MDLLKIYNGAKKIHFVGIGGVSVSAIAEHALLDGKSVKGSDVVQNSMTKRLATLGANINIGHKKENVYGADIVVATSAVGEDNVEIAYARQIGIPIFKRSQVLGAILSGYKKVIAVSGSHGKTTATAMISEALISSGINPTAFVGGETKSFGNFRKGEHVVAITEACEYQKNLLDLSPDVAVILNVDNDHMDSYQDKEDLLNTFRLFSQKSLRVINADDENLRATSGLAAISFAINNPAHYAAERIKYNGKGYSFTVRAYSALKERINLKIGGIHNVYNALATYAVCDLFGMSSKKIKVALENFSGVKRRNEVIGQIFNKQVVADYAHHPREIEAILNTHRIDKDVAVIFQPHTYSRTKLLMREFVDVLVNVENLFIYKTYAAREEYDFSGSAINLANNLNSSGKECKYIDNEEQLCVEIAAMNPRIKKILVLGAGDIYDIVKNLMDKNKEL